MANEDANYVFPWGFHLGDLYKGSESIPLYTTTSDGGFCLLYDKDSEKKADTLLESLCLELLLNMPQKSLKIDIFDFGKKKFYHLSPLQYIQLYTVSHNANLISNSFEALEALIVSRHTELLCCNRKTIDEHNSKSKMKQSYRLLLVNLENFPTEGYTLRRIENLLESASQAGVFIIAFGYQEIEQSKNETRQAFLKYFKTLRVSNGEFVITPEIFEFTELLDEREFKSLDLNKQGLLQEIMQKADLEKLMDPEQIQLEEDTKVK